MSERHVSTRVGPPNRHGTAIQWTHGDGYTGETWNPVTGCSKVSPGCANCYAETITARFAGKPGWIEEHRPWTPENAAHNVRLHPERLDQPLRWQKPRMVFVNSMSDLFHEQLDYHFIRDVFNTMRSCDGGITAATGKARPSHIFQVLTKRPEQALELWRDRKLGFEKWPPHIWLGVSIENARYTWRADILREIPAAVRFISAEPLLGSLFRKRDGSHFDAFDIEEWHTSGPLDLTAIDWVIAGGESGGRDSRPMRLDWARELRDACVPGGPHSSLHAPVAFFFKQWGSHAPDDCGEPEYVGASPKSGGRLLDGREWNEMPGRLGAA